MAASVDYWIKSCDVLNDGLKFTAVRLSTWETEEFILSASERQDLRDAWSRLGSQVHTIDGMRNCIATWTDTSPPIPLAYLGNAQSDIVPDVHEPASSAASGCQRTALHAGDYFWVTKHSKVVMVERKQLENGELLNTLFRPRGTFKDVLEAALTAQVKKMQQCADIRILLIELGYYRVDKTTGLIILPASGRVDRNNQKNPIWPYKWRDVQKALMSLCDAWGLNLWYTHDKYHTADDLLEIRDYLNKDSHSSQRTVARQVIVSDGVEYPPEVQMLCFAAGIGPVLAERALSHFGSIKVAANASLSDWRAIPGFGKVKASEIYNSMNRMYIQEAKTASSK